MSVVGTLTVDLVANTATFTADLGKAGNSLDDLGKKAKQAGDTMDYSMMEARGALAMTGEELGVHIPRHLQTLIATIPGIGEAFATMLPIVGVVAAIAIIAKLIEKSDEAKTKLDEAWAAIGRSGVESMDALRLKTLQVQEATQKLAGDYLGALRTQIQIINMEKLDAIDKEFQKLGADAEKTFEGMKVGWLRTNLLLQGNDAGVAAVNARFQKLVETVDEYKQKGDDKGIITTLDAEHDRLLKVIASMQDQNTYTKTLHDANEKALALIDLEIDRYKERDKAAKGEGGNAKTEESQQEATRLEERNDAVKAFADKALHAEQEFEKQRAEVRKRSAEIIAQYAIGENKAVEEAWKEHVKVLEGLGQEEVKNAIAMAKIQESAEEQSARHLLAMKQSTRAQEVSVELAASQQRLLIETAALDKEHALLAQGGEKDFVALKANEDKKTQLIAQATAEQTKIRDAALEKQYQDTARVENQIAGSISKTLTQGILESKNMGQAFKKMGAEMLESAMETAMKVILLNKEGQVSDAGAAATAAYKSAIKAYPAPYNMAIGVAQAAMAFSGAMAFAGGGEVPGMGTGDTVPAMLTPGETVVTKSLTDQVRNSRGSGGHTIHYAPTIHAVDSDGVQDMLEKHEAVFTAHVMSTLRKNHVRG
jgi:hypothetical protein